MHWPVQDAKQRFSEVLRAVETQGPQTITRHGRSVAVVVEMAEYRRLTRGSGGFVEHLAAFPKLTTSGEPDVFDEIAAERAEDLPREAL